MRGRKVWVSLVAPGERVRDPDGRWEALGTPVRVRGVLAPAPSGFTSRGAHAHTRNANTGILLLPSDVTVDTEMTVDVTGARTLPDGEYRVDSVARTEKHLRCLINRRTPGGS